MRRKILLKGIICAILAISILGVAVFKFQQNKSESDVKFGVLPTLTEKEVDEQVKRSIDEGAFNVTIANEIYLDNSEFQGKADIQNIANNHYDLGVEIIIDDTQEVVYQSDIMKPGSYIETVKLQKHLKQGEHSATAIFTAYDSDDGDVVGTTSIAIKLQVIQKI